MGSGENATGPDKMPLQIDVCGVQLNKTASIQGHIWGWGPCIYEFFSIYSWALLTLKFLMLHNRHKMCYVCIRIFLPLCWITMNIIMCPARSECICFQRNITNNKFRAPEVVHKTSRKQAVVRGTTNPAPCCHLPNDTDLLTA